MNLTGLHLQAMYELLAMQQQEITRLTIENQQLKRQHHTLTEDIAAESVQNGLHSHVAKS